MTFDLVNLVKIEKLNRNIKLRNLILHYFVIIDNV